MCFAIKLDGIEVMKGKPYAYDSVISEYAQNW
jgi:hypothetical protein